MNCTNKLCQTPSKTAPKYTFFREFFPKNLKLWQISCKLCYMKEQGPVFSALPPSLGTEFWKFRKRQAEKSTMFGSGAAPFFAIPRLNFWATKPSLTSIERGDLQLRAGSGIFEISQTVWPHVPVKVGRVSFRPTKITNWRRKPTWGAFLEPYSPLAVVWLRGGHL